MDGRLSAHVDTFCRDRLPDPARRPHQPLDLLGGALQYPQRLNCASVLLDETVAAFGADRVCLRTPEETWTYGELLARANNVAQVLVEDFGLVPGNRVLLRGANTPWLVAAWLGVVKAGCVAVTTMPMLRTRELTVLAELTRPALALCDHRAVDDLLACAAPGMRIMEYGGSGRGDLTARCRGRDGVFADVDTASSDVVLLAPTSGTTGRPKVTMHTHRDVLAVADTFSRHVLQPTPDDLFTGSPPLGFTFGLGGLLVFPLRAGAATLLLDGVNPAGMAELAAAHGATMLFTAPAAYRSILAAGRAPSLAGLRRCVSAGEHLPRSVWEQLYRTTGLRIIDGIGSTEMLHIFIGSAEDQIRPGSTGRVVPGFEARIVDERGDEVPDGVAGQLAVRGPTGCRYLADDRQTEYVRHGWNITGDIFVRDADGYFWFQARADDMIIASGYNVAGPEVEAVLLEHPDVQEVAVVGVPDRERGTIVKAFVVPSPAASAGGALRPYLTEELRTLVRRTVAVYKCPREFAFVDALPRTSTGKVRRSVLRQEAARAAEGAVR